MFKLSQRSVANLGGVDERLTEVVVRAIELTKVDFGVTCGLRSWEEQERLVAAGKSQTMNSKHLDGKAVDLVAYCDGQISREINLYDDVAEAMRTAAHELDVDNLRWGAAWHIDDICEYMGTMETANLEYIDLRRSQNRRPFIDAPHFELGD